MIIVNDSITIDELKEMAKRMYGNLVKAVVDVEREMMVLDADMHADAETLFLEQGSQQQNLWGINLYPELELTDEGFVEFDSMINLRPALGNRTRGVDDENMQKKILEIVNKLVKKS